MSETCFKVHVGGVLPGQKTHTFYVLFCFCFLIYLIFVLWLHLWWTAALISKLHFQSFFRMNSLIFGVWKYFLDIIFCRFSVSIIFCKFYCNDSSWNAVILSVKYLMKKLVSKWEDLTETWNVTAGTFLKEELLWYMGLISNVRKDFISFFPHTGLIQFECFTQHSGLLP